VVGGLKQQRRLRAPFLYAQQPRWALKKDTPMKAIIQAAIIGAIAGGAVAGVIARSWRRNSIGPALDRSIKNATEGLAKTILRKPEFADTGRSLRETLADTTPA
jgi:hypothetical protein